MSLLCAITKLFTDFHQIHRGIKMTNRTEQIRTAELIKDINNHPNKAELIQLMYQQIQEDTQIVSNVQYM